MLSIALHYRSQAARPGRELAFLPLEKNSLTIEPESRAKDHMNKNSMEFQGFLRGHHRRKACL
jgi:hypothetical protein